MKNIWSQDPFQKMREQRDAMQERLRKQQERTMKHMKQERERRERERQRAEQQKRIKESHKRLTDHMTTRRKNLQAWQWMQQQEAARQLKNENLQVPADIDALQLLKPKPMAEETRKALAPRPPAARPSLFGRVWRFLFKLVFLIVALFVLTLFLMMLLQLFS